MFLKLVSALSLAVVGSIAQAAMVVYNDFSDLTNLQLNGTAAALNPGSTGRLRLTDDLRQASSAFMKNTMSLSNQASFSAAFDFQITDPQGISDGDGQGADGIVFVLQTVDNMAGGTGGSIGYGGLENSIGIEFDTWFNGRFGDADGNHVGINLNGSVTSVQQRNVGNRMNNGQVWSVWIDYDGIADVLEVRIAEDGARTQLPFLTTVIDLESVLGVPDAYVGFTSGTGGAGGDHDILSFQFRDNFDPIESSFVVSPGSLPLLGIGLLSLGMFSRNSRSYSQQRVRKFLWKSQSYS